MTHEELLGLPPEGYKKILEMGEDELKEYLKDITILEPEIEVKEDELDLDSEIENFKPAKKKASSKKSGKISHEDFEKMIDESGILGESNDKLKGMF